MITNDDVIITPYIFIRRERAQWVGDLKMSCIALKTLCNNEEVIHFVHYQVAQSYSPLNGTVQMMTSSLLITKYKGMVSMTYPSNFTDRFIPGYHLLFCLSIVKNQLFEKNSFL